MQSRKNEGSEKEPPTKEDIDRVCDLIDEMWSRELEKGDDEFYESVKYWRNDQKNTAENDKPKRKKGRRI